MNRDEAISLTHKFLTGELSPDERKRFLAWKSSSRENSDLVDEIALLWDASGSYKTPAFDSAQAFERMPFSREEPRKEERRSPGLMALVRKTAAVVVLLVAAGWIAYSLTRPEWQVFRASDSSFVVLKDGSEVHLREGARLEVPDRFSGKMRAVRLAGDAFFKVVREADRKFVVQARYADITVLGTEFGVRTDTLESTLAVYVTGGEVRLQPHKSSVYIDVAQGQGGIYNNISSELRRIREADMNAIAWHTGELSFINTPMHEVIETLAEVYRVEIDISRTSIRNCLYTSPVQVDGTKIDEILDGMALVYRLKVSSPDPGRYVLVGGTCRQPGE